MLNSTEYEMLLLIWTPKQNSLKQYTTATQICPLLKYIKTTNLMQC